MWDIGVRNTNVANPDQSWRDPALYGQLKSDIDSRESNGSISDEEMVIGLMQNLDQPDEVSNSGRVNYGPSTVFQSSTGLSSGEIETQLPHEKSTCQSMKELQQMRNIDLQRKIFYGVDSPKCQDPSKALAYPRYVWETPTSVSNYFKASFPEDSPFDPMIPYHL